MKKGTYIPIVATRRQGSSQDTRQLPQADPEFVQIQGKSLTQRLQFFYQMAGMVNFYDVSNSLDGSWSKLFQGDISFILSQMSVYDPTPIIEKRPQMEMEFQNSLQFSRKRQALAGLFALSIEVATQLALWVGNLRSLETDPLQVHEQLCAILRANARRVIPSWSKCFYYIVDEFGDLPEGYFPTHTLRDVSHAQDFLLEALHEEEKNNVVDTSILKDYGLLEKYIRDALDDFIRCTILAAELAVGLFPKSLQLATHKPHNALVIAFQELLEKPIQTLNSFSQKHLDFYYRKVLQLKPLGGIPDHAFLQFSPAKGVSIVRIPAGTELDGGKTASGLAVTYTTDKDLFVNQAVVSRVMTVFNGGAGVANPWEFPLMMAPVADSADGMGKKFATPDGSWEVMGGPGRGGENSQPAMVKALPGLVISDPVLFLSSGHRTVDLFFEINEPTLQELVFVLDQFAKKGEKREGIFARLVSAGLKVSYTGPKGWEMAETVQKLELVLADSKSGKFRDRQGLALQLILPESAPPLEALTHKAHGIGQPEGTPALRLTLDQDFRPDARRTDPKSGEISFFLFSPYNLLRKILIETIYIQTTVKGKSDLVLQNDQSLQPPKKPFSPFGPQPEAGNGLMIGSPEVFRKNLTDLKISLEWAKLPRENFGFLNYYQTWTDLNLGTTLRNSSFKVRFSLLNKGKWANLALKNEKNEMVDSLPLFQWDGPHAAEGQEEGAETVPEGAENWLLTNIGAAPVEVTEALTSNAAEDGLLRTNTVWNGFDFAKTGKKISEIPGPTPPEFSWGPEVQSGFLRMELAAPLSGFGDGKYLELINFVTQANIAAIAGRAADAKEPLKLLSQPVLPFQLNGKSLQLDYVAQATLRPGRLGTNSGLHFLQPFGVTPAALPGQSLTLVPDYDHEGYLYLAIENVVAPQVLSLFFQVDVDSVLPSDEPSPHIEWSRLVNGTWVEFSVDQILEDSTAGFIRPGIVRINLGEDPAPDGGWFNAVENRTNLLWLRASAKTGTHTFCKVRLLTTQVVRATFQSGEADHEHLIQSLPAGTIKKMLNPVPGIAKVNQPFPSFGGHPPENDTRFYTRIQERLRHKQRAITPWDIERMVLQKFPEIGRANCFRTSDNGGLMKPGKVIVSVFPARLATEGPNKYTPKISRNQLLDVYEFLKAHAPHSMEIEVRNPDYEYLQLLADIEFLPGYDAGFYLKQLEKEVADCFAPWSTQNSNEANPYETMVSLASLKGFVLGKEYVASLTRFQLLHFVEEGKKTHFRRLPGEFAYIKTSMPWGILTTKAHQWLRDVKGPERKNPIQALGMYIQNGPGTRIPDQIVVNETETGSSDFEYIVIGEKT
ncbi:MAG: baseplate J/gp47 family protein [Bacteroidia bacterium]|nr:baseplate J/gp47 family protein [Bacteroidia bacterium]